MSGIGLNPPETSVGVASVVTICVGVVVLAIGLLFGLRDCPVLT
jgi:hypothetical protein